jgi:hypothetical protein
MLGVALKADLVFEDSFFHGNAICVETGDSFEDALDIRSLSICFSGPVGIMTVDAFYMGMSGFGIFSHFMKSHKPINGVSVRFSKHTFEISASDVAIMTDKANLFLHSIAKEPFWFKCMMSIMAVRASISAHIRVIGMRPGVFACSIPLIGCISMRCLPEKGHKVTLLA